MTQIVVDAEVLEKLKGLAVPLEFRDEAGNILGRFEPDQRSPAFREWFANLGLELSADEVELRVQRARDQGLSTEQILARLRETNP